MSGSNVMLAIADVQVSLAVLAGDEVG
jgi:hypothetical protein